MQIASPVASQFQPSPAVTGIRRRFTPSPVELLCFALVLWLIGYTVAGGGTGLIRDSQTGYHIRIGEYVLQHRAAPNTDFLSFTRPGESFFAWEWLTGVGTALLYHWQGLRAIIVVSALLIGLTVLVMMRHMAWRGANVLIVVGLIHIAIGASSIHYLARPHLFTLLFLATALWLLDKDRRHATLALWALVPLTALWVNLHGGFFGLLVTTGVLAGGSGIEWLLNRKPETLRYAIRYSLLTGVCFLASLVNPYGIREHIHLVDFLRETWYLTLTEEFQPPHLLSAAGIYHALLFAGGVILAGVLLRRKRIAPALLILAWAFAACRSVRHVPIYAMVVLPWAAGELAVLWGRWTAGKSRASLAGILETMAADYQPSLRRTSWFPSAAALLLLLFSFGLAYPADFPESVYPVSLVARHSDDIARARVFTTDGWGHYLTFRYPEPYRIFIDGRADFFGERFTKEYLATLNGEPGWQDTFKRYRVEMALVPPEAPLATLLRSAPGWRLVEESSQAVLFSSL